MKIRSDYVTNSSSSSFVIGKKDDESVTIESAFQLIKDFYKEFLSKRDAVIQYIKTKPELGLVYRKSKYGNYYNFDFTVGNFAKEGLLKEIIERDFGISIWDNFEAEYNWLNCKSYQDYEKYWLDKMTNSNLGIHAPFTICDFFEEKEVNWLHYNGDKRVNKVNSKSNILNWYFECAEEVFANKTCEECGASDWCDKEECEKERKLITEGNIPENKACLYLLGRICIHSEDCYMPEYVTDKLSIISEYSCNHMG